MNHRLIERGQAMAEYMPLIPPVLLLSIVILIPLANNASNVFCQVVNVFDPAACEPAEEDLLLEDDTCTNIDFTEGASTCSQTEDCVELPGVNEGTYWHSTNIEAFVIKAGQNYHIFNSGLTDDGCYYVEIFANYVEWIKVGDGADCQDVSHAETWEVPVCLPE